jgi:WD40 repeat protein
MAPVIAECRKRAPVPFPVLVQELRLIGGGRARATNSRFTATIVRLEKGFESMWTAHWLVRLRCGIVSVMIVMAAAFECLPVRGQATVSVKLIQTLSHAELASYEPFSKQGVLAVRVGDMVQLWDTQPRTLKTNLPHHEKIDGRRVVRYGGKKGFLWEATSGRLIADLTPPEERDILIPWYSDITLEGALFSPDSRVIATQDSLNSIELWDADTGRLRALLQGHRSTIYTLAFSRDGCLLASASRDGTARLWNVETGQLVATLSAGREIAGRVVFNPEGTLLAVAYHTQARVWNVSSGQLQATLSPHSDINKTVLFGTYLDRIEILLSPQGKLLLTAGNKSVKIGPARAERLRRSDQSTRH